MDCPNCNKIINSQIIVNDGGSKFCEHCKSIFHKCSGDIIKYGSPGPSMCDFCKYITCPDCYNQTSAHNCTKQGDIICRHCKVIFHKCLGNIPKCNICSVCVFCPLKEIS